MQQCIHIIEPCRASVFSVMVIFIYLLFVLLLTERKKFYQDVNISQGAGKCFMSILTDLCDSKCTIEGVPLALLGRNCRFNVFDEWIIGCRFTKVVFFCFMIIYLFFSIFTFLSRWFIWDKPRQKETENTWRKAVHGTQWSPRHRRGNWVGCSKGHAQVLHYAPGTAIDLALEEGFQSILSFRSETV